VPESRVKTERQGVGCDEISYKILLALAGKLMDELGGKARSNTTAKHLPEKIKKKVNGYSRQNSLLGWADKDILALLAMTELIWEEALRPLASKSHEGLQLHLGVNALSRRSTQAALREAVGYRRRWRSSGRRTRP